MAIAVTSTKNALCTAYANIATTVYISVHTADPGTNGANEASGGSPAYKRVATTWSAPANGQITGSQVTIDLPAGTYTHAGLWSALNGGTFIDKVAIASTTLGAQGTLLITPTFTMS
ncbi:phage tail fiber protein [Nocardia sp. bgisy134]|uniref:phage tail fiber protein n=1 Tax=unclassified Nocardia TaxID=2637762 RepID=UPI003D743B17